MTALSPAAGTTDLSVQSIDELAGEITLLSAHIQAATCRLLVLIAEMDRREGYGDLHFASCAHWLSFCTGESLPTAREKVRVARKVIDCPLILQAFSKGQISYSKVRAVTRVVTPENEQQLLELSLDCSTSQLERVVRTYRQAAPAEAELSARQQQRRYLSYYIDDDNMFVLRGRLTPEQGAVLVKALQVAQQEQQARDEEPDHELCDALEQVAGAALDKGLAHRAGKARPNTYQVLLKVDEQVLADPDAEGRCEVQGAVGVSVQTAKRICCDAPVMQVHEAADCHCDAHDGRGNALHLKRSRRRASAALERAVRVRDEGVCQFPGCENRRYLHLHHIEHWADGGGTDLDNLCLLCSGCHRRVHEGGYCALRTDDGELVFYSPGGRPLSNRPQPVKLSEPPVAALLSAHEDITPPITQQTGRPGWDGMFVVDYDEAVFGLLESEQAAGG